MTPAQALAVLGLDPGALWPEVKAAYRGLMREHHPDRGGVASRAALITQAYALLESTWVEPEHPAPSPLPERGPSVAGHPPAGKGPVQILGGDTIALEGDAETAFTVLLDAAHDMGEVSFVDTSICLLETVIELPGTPASSLVVSLQGRHDHVEAFCTVEALDGSTPPPLPAVVEVLADLVRQQAGVELDRPVQAPAEWLAQRPTGTP